VGTFELVEGSDPPAGQDVRLTSYLSTGQPLRLNHLVRSDDLVGALRSAVDDEFDGIPVDRVVLDHDGGQTVYRPWVPPAGLSSTPEQVIGPRAVEALDRAGYSIVPFDRLLELERIEREGR
jgi:hypothetical protein